MGPPPRALVSPRWPRGHPLVPLSGYGTGYGRECTQRRPANCACPVCFGGMHVSPVRAPCACFGAGVSYACVFQRLLSSPLFHIYIGFGLTDSQCRPSLFANPYRFVCDSAMAARASYAKWLEARCDLHDFLYPLSGRTLVCDCDCGELCHGLLLVSLVNEKYSACSELDPFPCVATPDQPNACDSTSFADCSGAVGSTDHPDSADESGDEAPVSGRPLSSDDLTAVNETVRGTRLRDGQERPKWKPAWFHLDERVYAAGVVRRPAH